MNTRTALASLLIPVALLMLACSGGGISVDIRGPSLSSLPTDELATALGVIASDQGLVVNDTVWGTGSASVRINGLDASRSALKRGHKVFVSGTIGPLGLNGSADFVVYDADLVGRVEIIDADSRQIVVMGQRVVLDHHTVFGPAIDTATLEGLSAGDRVNISGFRTADDSLVATRVELETTTSGEQIVGRVSSLDHGRMVFEIHGLPVDYHRAGLIELPDGAPRDGMSIVASGTLVDGALIATALRAASVPLPGRVNERVIVQGVVTFSQALRFLFGEVAMRVGTDTDYINGDLGDLTVDTRLVVDGRIAADGQTILANAIRFSP